MFIVHCSCSLFIVPTVLLSSLMMFFNKNVESMCFDYYVPRFAASKWAASTMTSPRSSSRTSLWPSRAPSSESRKKSESEESQ